jgi:biopolymer transport protein ExbD
MDFSPHPRRSRPENIVPMINVVFLLLIFFLMTAQIAPPDLFEVSLPLADSEVSANQGDILLLNADGLPGFAGHQGEDVFQALARRESRDTPLLIRADAAMSARRLAIIMARLTALGVTDIELMTEPR